MPAMSLPDHANANDASWVKRIGFWLGPVLCIAILASPTPDGVTRVVKTKFADDVRADAARALGQTTEAGDSTPEAYRRAEAEAIHRRARAMLAAGAVTAWVACWWITVAIPIPVTSLLPLVLFPLLGVLPIKEAAAPYANSNVFLFMGGFIIALAIERWGLHRRIALHIVKVVGTSPATIVLGFMVACAVLSMWISNTATTLMMLPIGLAIIAAVKDFDTKQDAKGQANFAAALMLGIAYSASVGGIATPIGTPPNISFRGQLVRLFPQAPEISFGQWMVVFLPLVIVFLPVIWLVLTRITCPVSRQRLDVGREVISDKLRDLGAMKKPERRMLVVFVATALLWVTRTIPIGGDNYGWSACLQRILGEDGQGPFPFSAAFINDATVALAMAILLFVVPSGSATDAKREPLMDWPTAQKLPWGILLLFGGGFSIAAGFGSSGLSQWCGQAFSELGVENPLYLVSGTCAMMTFLTEVTSNTATTEVMLPILAGGSQSMGVHPLLLMLPAAISASCAFMMPVATPPNAIVFGSGCVSMGRMVRTGIIINLIGIVLVTAVFYLVAVPLLGITPHTLPAWAG